MLTVLEGFRCLILIREEEKCKHAQTNSLRTHHRRPDIGLEADDDDVCVPDIKSNVPRDSLNSLAWGVKGGDADTLVVKRMLLKFRPDSAPSSPRSVHSADIGSRDWESVKLCVQLLNESQTHCKLWIMVIIQKAKAYISSHRHAEQLLQGVGHGWIVVATWRSSCHVVWDLN